VCDLTGPFEPVTLGPLEQLPMRCNHCGTRYVLALPMSVTMLAMVARQFAKEHRRCKPRPSTTHPPTG
jgi:hypothetical protein